VPSVSLDGLVLDMPHDLGREEATRRIELVTEDLSKGLLSSQSPRISRPGTHEIVLSGGKGNSSFEARIEIGAERVTVALTGQLELTRIALMIAGGEAGVRRRVRTEVEHALLERLAAA
jgi:hypothetical protein